MKDDRLYLIHIAESIDKIEAYIADLDYSAFMENTMVQPCFAICKFLLYPPSAFQTISNCNILKLNGIKSPVCEISWFMITWVSTLRQCGLFLRTICRN